VLSYLSGKVGSEKSSAITGLNGGRTRDRTLDLSRVMATPTVIKSACYRGFAVFSAVFSTLSPGWDVDLWSLPTGCHPEPHFSKIYPAGS
jgi:hypothetical protein